MSEENGTASPIVAATGIAGNQLSQQVTAALYEGLKTQFPRLTRDHITAEDFRITVNLDNVELRPNDKAREEIFHEHRMAHGDARYGQAEQYLLEAIKAMMPNAKAELIHHENHGFPVGVRIGAAPEELLAQLSSQQGRAA